MTDDERVAEIGKILATWGPVDKKRVEAIGLSNYDVEAQDILWATQLHGYSVKRAVSAVLQEAFLIDLDKTELDRCAGEIAALLAKK